MADPKKALSAWKAKYGIKDEEDEKKESSVTSKAPTNSAKEEDESISSSSKKAKDPKAALSTWKEKYSGDGWKANKETAAQNTQTDTKRSQYYSQPELWKDKDRLYSAITEVEPVFVEKQKQVESASKRLKELETAVKNNPHDEKAYKEYETAYNAYKVLASEYEPLYNTYTEAVNAYNAYVEDQNGQYNAWRSTVRDAAEIAKDLEALDKQIKSATYAKHAFSVESREDATGGGLAADKAAEYTAELEKLQQQRALLLEEKEWAEHLHYADMMEGNDFKKYSAQGAAIENPEYKDGLLGLAGLNLGKVGNVVTYSRDNLDAIKANEKASTVGKIVDKLSGGKFISPLDGAGDSIYGYMTEDEVDIYNYLLAKEGEDSAKEYLKHLEEYLNARKGKEMGETVRGIDNGILRAGATGAYGLVAGVDQFGSGIKQFVSPKELPTSALQYGSQYIQEDLDDTKVGKYLYGAATTVGNMAPSILVSAITGGLGASAAVAQTVGAATMGVSASGNAYKEKLAEGYSKSQARTYSALVGASEAALQRLLGGIGKLGGVTDDLILAKVGAIDKAWARVALTGAVKLGSEITEEELQLFLEPLFNKWVFGGNYDAPTIEEMAETAIITALSTGALEAGSIAQAGSNQTSKLGNKINGAGTESLHAIIEEGLATDPSSTSYALAKQLQQKIERGETVTDQEIGNLYRANVENVDTQADPDDALMQAATEAVSHEMGETATEAPQSVSESVLSEEVKVPSEARNVTQAQTSEATAGKQSVPYNAMNTNEPARLSAVQKMRAAERTLATSNYGENGKEAFGAILKNNPNANPKEVMARFDAPYQVGLTGTPVEKTSFVNDFQKEAYTAGIRDYNITQAADAQHTSKTILSEQESGFDHTGMPKDISQAQKDFSAWFLSNMGVKGKWDGYDGVSYNGFFNPDPDLDDPNSEPGIVHFAQDFGISPKLMEKLGSMDYQQKVEKLASERGHSFVFYVAHEVAGHVAMDRAPKEMRAFANAMYNYKQGKTAGENLARSKQAFYASRGKTLDTNAAIEEVVSDSILDLYDGDEQAFMDAMHRVFNSTNEDAKKGARKYLELLKDTIAKLKAWVKKLTGAENAQAKENMEQGISELEQLRDMFEKAIAASMKAVQESRANGDVVKSIKDGLGDGSTVQTNKKGDMLIAESKDGSKIAFSYKTYDNGGREKLRAALLRNGHTRTEIDSTLALIEDAADYLKILAAGYAKSHNYNALHDHLIADITTNLKTGKQVMSALVNNGDYPVNIDLALICKKRVAYMNLMTRLIEDGIFDMVNYKGEAIADVNDILRANNFETACLGCFVESRRLQFQTWAETIVSEWNDEVSKRKKNAKAFGFSSKNYATLTDSEMDALQREIENAGKKNKQGNLNLGTGSVKVKIGRLLDKVPSLQQTLTTADLLTPAGLAALRAYDSNLFSIVKSRYGAASPKIVQDFNPYASEIAMMTFKSVSDITSNAVKGAQTYIQQAKKDAGGVPKKQKGESDAAYRKRKAEWNAMVENNAMRRYLYDIGGARIQSFSDFMIENVFDYLQIFADLAANRFPLHGYTKEIVSLRLFGMTGAKWNGSLIAHTERSMGKEYAGLLPASAAKDGSAILLHTADGDYAIGFDDYARNKATGGKSFIQSIGMKDIVALQLDPRYSGNVGSITIGVSDKQILAMLDSPLFSMVIPYHSSGMLPGFAQRVGVDMYNDYTDYQNTTVRQLFDADGNRVETLTDSAGKAIKIDTSYAFNEEVQRTGDAREAANNYIKWCSERHPVHDGKKLVGYATFSPKFSDSPYGTDFSRHPNYYKLLEDFNTYDCITGASAVQGPVTMTFPSESNRLSASEMEAYKQRLRDTGIFSEKEIAKYENLANKTFKELIADEVKGRAAYKVTQDAKWEKTVSEIKDKLMSDYARAEKTSNETGRMGETRDTMSYSMKEDAQNGQRADFGTVYGSDVRDNGNSDPDRRGYGSYTAQSRGAVASFARGNETTAGEGSGAELAKNIIEATGVHVVVVKDHALRQYRDNSLALTIGDTVYLSDAIPTDIGVVIGYHELVHFAKQSENQAYIGFLNSTPHNLDETTDAYKKLFGVALSSRYKGQKFSDLNSNQQMNVYDEINAIVYGFYKDSDENARYHFFEAFKDYDGYIRGLVDAVESQEQQAEADEFSLKGEEDMRAELKRIRDEGKKAGKSAAEIDQEIIDAVGQEYGELLKVYGEIQRGEKPAREIKVPSRTGKNRRVSQTIRTILEAQVTPETSVPTIKQMIAEGEFSHDVYTDDAAIANAEDIIRSKTYGVALAEWIRDVENGKVSKTSTALGWALYNEAATANDTETAMTILNYMVGHQRNAAQAVQATRILKKLTPDAQLYSAVRSVQKLEEDLNKGRKENTEEAKRAAGEVGQAKKEAAAAASKALSGAKVKRQGNRVTIDSNQAGEPFVFEYAQKVGEAVAKGLEAKRNRSEKERTFLQQITAQLKRFAAEKMPKEKKGKPLTAIDLLRDYIQNQAFYADAWAYAQEELREKYAGDPVFDEFINTGIGVDSNANPNNAIFMRALVKAAADSGEGRAVLRKQEALGFTGMADTIANNLIEQTGAEGEMAETIRDAAHAYVYSELQADGKDNAKIVDASIRSAMTDIGLKVSEVVNSGTGETAKQAIVDKLVAKYGIGYAEATHTADIVSDRFEQMCRDYSQRRLESMFKERKVSQKTIPEKIEALARLGAFDIGSAYNQKAAERIFKAGVTLTVNEELARQFMQAETQEERDNILADIYRDIGRQMPSTFKDKWNAWRYLAMLGNPRTHVRNVFGNLGFAPVVIAKDATATMIESAVGFVSGGKMGRTKAMPSLKLLKAAWADYANVAAEISAGGKYNDAAIKNQHIEEGRVIFKLKPLEMARKGNSAAMEAEDTWFARPHYAFALAQYCKAHGVTVENLQKGKALGNARAYAIKEAQKATYRDTNAFSQAISELGRYHGDNKVKKAISMVSEGILPFRKTPANILVRGIEYSPVGLLKSLLVDLVKVGKGDMTAAEAIDNISAGLTGTGLLALGVWMAAEGLIRGSGGGEEEEKEFEELQGHQAYSLELPGGTSVTLDWLAPEVLPLFIGVNIAEMARENKGDSSMSDILTAVSNVTEPLLEMSCLQSLNDLFDSFGYATSNGLDALPSALISAATSYLTQAFPTLLGQAERSAQDERMTTYTEKNNFLTSDMQYLLGKISAKIPGWDYQQIPYIDAWGRTESTGTKAENAANNFLNPAYMSQIETSAMEEELKRLYDDTGEKSVLPDRADKYFNVDKERKDLTAEEYVKYATEKGQLSYDLLTEIMDSPKYSEIPDDLKVDIVGWAYEYANSIAKSSVSDYEPEGWVADAIKLKESTGMDEVDYILYKAALEMNDTPNKNGELGGAPTNAEKATTILSMGNLSAGEITALWDTEKGYEAYAAGVDMRAYVEHVSKGGKVTLDKLIEVLEGNIDADTYFAFSDMLDKYDQPTESGKYGTFTQDEVEDAIRAMTGLTQAQKAYLWQSVNKGWKEKNNPWK